MALGISGLNTIGDAVAHEAGVAHTLGGVLRASRDACGDQGCVASTAFAARAAGSHPVHVRGTHTLDRIVEDRALLAGSHHGGGRRTGGFARQTQPKGGVIVEVARAATALRDAAGVQAICAHAIAHGIIAHTRAQGHVAGATQGARAHEAGARHARLPTLGARGTCGLVVARGAHARSAA